MSIAERDIILGEMIPQWTSGVQEMANYFKVGFEEVCKESLDKLATATKDYENTLIDIGTEAGTAFDKISFGADEAVIQTQSLLDVNRELVESYDEQLKKIDKLIKKMKEFLELHSDSYEFAEDVLGDTNDYITSNKGDQHSDEYSDDQE